MIHLIGFTQVENLKIVSRQIDNVLIYQDRRGQYAL